MHVTDGGCREAGVHFARVKILRRNLHETDTKRKRPASGMFGPRRRGAS
jgi:hypothetical protein